MRDSVNSSPMGSELAPVLSNPHPPVGGVQDGNQIANSKMRKNIFRRHGQTSFVAYYHGAAPSTPCR